MRVSLKMPPRTPFIDQLFTSEWQPRQIFGKCVKNPGIARAQRTNGYIIIAKIHKSVFNLLVQILRASSAALQLSTVDGFNTHTKKKHLKTHSMLDSFLQSR